MKTLLFALGALALVGCTNVKPIGPFAKDPPITQQGKPIPGVTPDSTAKPLAVRPTPPTTSVGPNDVNLNNPYVAADKLTSELAVDSKAAPNAPVTAEVSRIQGRR